jgi:myo-inositol-1-phosphate synthase
LKVKVAIVGVGNVASALVQALEIVKGGRSLNGLRTLPISPEDVEVVTAFDVDKRKVGKTLGEAVFSPPNVVNKYVEVRSPVQVLRGPTWGSIEGIVANVIEESEEREIDVTETLKELKVDVVLNLLPSGADEASLNYAKSSLQAGSAFVNSTPTPVAKELGESFRRAGVPLLGDDLLSQIGGTVTHASLIDFLRSRGVKVTRSYQVDIAGSTEALITLEDWRKEVKKRVKSNYISSKAEGVEVVAGTSDYVQFLGDRRMSYMVIEGVYSFGVPVRIDVSLKTYDGPNAVVPLLDLIRIAKLLKDRGIGGSPSPICSTYFKSPPENSGVDVESYLREVMSRTPV